MEINEIKTAIIVTSDFHLYRCMQFARKLKIDATGAPAMTYEPERLQHTARVIMAVLKYSFSDRF